MAGQHIGVFYETSTQLWSHCATILKGYLGAGEGWLFIADEHTPILVAQKLAEQGFALAHATIVDSSAYFFRSSPIRVAPILQAIEAFVLQAIDQGTPHLLIFLEMTWAIRTPSGAVYLNEFEAAIEALQQRLPITVVCLYSKMVMLDHQLLTALHAHPTLQIAHHPRPNPYFLPTSIRSKPDPRAQVEYWLTQLDKAEAAESPPIEEAKREEAQIQRTVHLRSTHHLDTFTPIIATNTDQGRWKIRCFGALHVYRMDGALVDWNSSKGATSKVKTLFAYLLIRGEQGASLEELADLLWPNAKDLAQSSNRLYHTVGCLRQALSPNQASGRQSPFLLHQNQRYYLAVPPETWIDLPMFQEVCYRGGMHLKHEDWEQAQLCYQSAERLYTGDLFADIPDKYAANREQDWCWSRRFWFREMYAKVLLGLATLHRRNSDWVDALAYCDKLLQLDPASENAHQEKMYTLAATGRVDALQRQYRLYCKALEQFEVGSPAPETTQLFESLLKSLKN